MKILKCQQRSDEWRQARLGKLTGSRVADAFATIKKGEAAGRRNLRTQLVLERLTGQPQDSPFLSQDMERGIVLEAEAAGAYEAVTGRVVTFAGFLEHDELAAGLSPDGLNVDAGVEIKCPKAATHLAYLRDGLPLEYKLQMMHGLWITGLPYWDFVSYCPEFPEHLRLKITRITPEPGELAAHELNVRLFLDEVDKEYAAVAAMKA